MGKWQSIDKLFDGLHFHREISGMGLMHRIRKGQFDLAKLLLKDAAAPAVWNAVLSAS
jgi:hypothetical protein